MKHSQTGLNVYSNKYIIDKIGNTCPLWIKDDKLISQCSKLQLRSIQNTFFLISQWKHILWYSLEVPQWGASNEYHNICFCGEIRKNILIFVLKRERFLSGAMIMVLPIRHTMEKATLSFMWISKFQIHSLIRTFNRHIYSQTWRTHVLAITCL